MNNNLLKIWDYCISNVPFYKNNKVYIDSKRFNELPIINKAIYQKNVPPLNMNLLAKDFSSAYILSTSGTTTKPQYIIRDFSDFDHQINDYVALNISKSDVVINLFWAGLWGIYTSANITLMKTGCTIIPFGGNNFNEISSIVNLIDQFNVNTLFGVPSTIIRLSEEIRDKVELRKKIKKIFCLGEKMHADTYYYLQRIYPNSIIKTKYGCMETAGIGYQCSKLEKNEYHVFNNRYVEILDKNNNPEKIGEKGRIIVTTLDERLIPLLRYETGDTGYFEQTKCICGQHMKLVIENRIDKEFILASIHLNQTDVNSIIKKNTQKHFATQLIIRKENQLDTLYIYIVAESINNEKIYTDLLKKYPDLVSTIKHKKMNDINIIKTTYQNLISNKKTGKLYPLLDTRK